MVVQAPFFRLEGRGGGFSREDSGSVAAGVVSRAIDPFFDDKAAVRRRRRGAPVTIAVKAAAGGR